MVGELDHDRMIEDGPGVPGRRQRVLRVADLDVAAQELVHQSQERARVSGPAGQGKGREPQREMQDRRGGEEQQRPARRAPENHDRRHRGHDRHAAAPLDRRREADEDRAREHTAPRFGRHGGEETPEDQAGQTAVEQRRARVGQKETVAGEERRREPACSRLREQRARQRGGDDQRLQAEDQRGGAPADRVVAEQKDPHRDEELAERRVVVVVGFAQQIAAGIGDEVMLVEREARGKRNAAHAQHDAGDDHCREDDRCRSPRVREPRARCAGPPGRRWPAQRRSPGHARVCSRRNRAFAEHASGQAPVGCLECGVARPAQRHRMERTDNLEVAGHRESVGRQPPV